MAFFIGSLKILPQTHFFAQNDVKKSKESPRLSDNLIEQTNND
ncbi:MAG: hypothetical protein HLUCCO02_07405 [Idiomarinaceae bacterium HL-53]|nr:MAG: hypothetical protein HLUCCO02_07405 [Idiomarinaceae bacterium HL-53]